MKVLYIGENHFSDVISRHIARIALIRPFRYILALPIYEAILGGKDYSGIVFVPCFWIARTSLKGTSQKNSSLSPVGYFAASQPS